jgi:hypothetical protein
VREPSSARLHREAQTGPSFRSSAGKVGLRLSDFISPNETIVSRQGSKASKSLRHLLQPFPESCVFNGLWLVSFRRFLRTRSFEPKFRPWAKGALS